MIYLLLAIIAAAVLHWIYEGILLPGWRMECRFRLFSLRDRLRHIKIASPNEVSDEVFSTVDTSLNTMISVIREMDLLTLAHIDSVLKADQKLAERIRRRRQIVEECKSEKLKAIIAERNSVADRMVAVNQIPLIGYLTVVILPLAGMVVIARRARDQIAELLSTPGSEVEKMMPLHAAT